MDQQMTNIVLCYPVEEKHVKQILEAWPGANVIDAGQQAIAEHILEADIFIGHAKVPVDWPEVVRRGRLRLIQSSAAGLDHCLVPAVIDSPIPVCSASGLFAKQVGEQTLALTLGLLRGLPTFFRQHQKREFVRRPTDDLCGKRIGIVGLGGNGRRIASLLKPFGVEIRATDFFPVRQPTEVSQLWGVEGLHALAAESDILILALPLNSNTHRVIDRSVLECMPSGGYLINVARGQVVDEPALVDALQQQHLRGAGLDVTYVEPLPADSPLWELPNVLITPHVGAQAASRVDDSTRLACENLRRFQANQDLLNLVDKQLGFPHPDRLAIHHPAFS